MNRLLTIIIVLLTPACNGHDYSLEGSLTQKVKAEKINYLIIECYCNNGVEITEKQTETITIDVVGELESVGYHGDQEKPKEIGKETLSFKTEIENDTLRLLSKEWSFIHHSFLIEILKIQIPKGLKYEIVKIDRGKLEAREIK